jgi:hypothetical protein
LKRLLTAGCDASPIEAGRWLDAAAARHDRRSEKSIHPPTLRTSQVVVGGLGRRPAQPFVKVSAPEGDERMKAFSKAAGVEYISAWHPLCNSEGCMTRVGPTASEVITTDNVHLSDAGSNFLIEQIKRSLFPQPAFNQD